MVSSIFMVLVASAAWQPQPGDAPVGENRTDPALAALAGDYYFGDGLGVNCSLTLTREGRFSFVWRGCMGVYDRNQGAAKLAAGHLILAPERPNERKGFRGMATDLIPVRWGERQYLVPEEDSEAFCNGVNAGGYLRAAYHTYVRNGDEAKKASGIPIVPKEWEPFLLKKPLKGKIIEVLDGGRGRVDFGSVSGVRKGMELWADSAEYGLLEVVEVDEKTCVVALKRPRRERTGLKKNQEVKSKFYNEAGDLIL